MTKSTDMSYWNKPSWEHKSLAWPSVHRLMGWVMGVTYLSALVFLASIVYEHGFRISEAEENWLQGIYKTVWGIFLISTTVQIVFRQEEGKSKFTGWAWVLFALLYLTLLPVVFHRPDQTEGVYGVWMFFHHPYYRMAILFFLSLFYLSSSLVRLLGRRTNPSLILAVSFLVLILIGSGLLMLPRCTYHGISWLDALFTATSATCVTGLVTVDVSSTFTLGGQIIIILLIQIGGLGVMTLTSFFAMFFMGNTSLYNQLAVRDMISSNSLNSLLSTLLYILGFTLMIEGVGMALIWLSIHNTMGMTLDEELYFAAFHSISAFCNAGFSTLPGNLGNSLVMQNHNLLFVTVSFLIILGGIGFPILVNLCRTVMYYLRYWKWKLFGRSSRFPKQVHLYNLNTKIVLIMTTVLLVVGTLVILVYEWNHAFAGMPVLDKWVHAFFNAVCPRTAGFCSVGLTTLSTQTVLFMILLMMIGGGTQSTAGGVKINVFAVILLNLWAVIRGSERVAIFHRELSSESVRRSHAVLSLYLIVAFVAVFAMTLIEPEASVMAIVFECVSALSTVGSSLDLTPLLSPMGKGVIIFLMFVGRAGAFTLLLGLVKQETKKNYKYPKDDLIIN